MKNDVHGCSTCKTGCEDYEKYTQRIGRKAVTMYQYDYRDYDGELFACCAPTLEACRERRNEWLKNKYK